MFRSLISNLFSAVYLAVDRLKGHRQFTEKVVCQNGLTTIIATSTEGYRATIIITKEEYVEHFTHRYWVRKSKHYLYTVSAEVSHDAPESLKHAVANEVLFPPLLPWFVGEKAQVQRVVRSYIDIIKTRARAHKR